MRLPLVSFTLAALVSAGLTAPALAEPPNVDLVESQVRAYVTSPAWPRDQAAVDGAAQRWIDARARAVRRPALVLDIDDTSVASAGYEVRRHFCYDPVTWGAAERAGFPVIPATLALARHAVARGVTLFFITGRSERERAVTVRNLRRDGYPAWKELHLRPNVHGNGSVSIYKSAERRKIEAEGYTIVANVGDQWSDLRGGSAERTFKLPNPMYFLP